MSQHKSPIEHRFVESLYDLKQGKTFVRHPNNMGEWLDVSLLQDVIKGHPVPYISGEDECKVYSIPPLPNQEHREKPRLVRLRLTSEGQLHCE